MKRLFFTLGLSLIVSLSFAQKKAVNSAKNELKGTEPNIEEARKLIKGALENPETADLAETWFVAGQVEGKQFDQESAKEISGKKPNEDVMYKALEGILPYFTKAYELDQKPDAKGKIKPKYTKDIRAIMKANHIYYINAGLHYYNKQDFKKAYANFSLFGDLPNLPMMEGEVFTIADSTATQIRYYAAMSASLIPDHDAAIRLYEEVKNKGYAELDIYRRLAYEYEQVKDTASLENLLLDGMVKFPEEDYFVLNLINVSINQGKTQQAVKALEEAIERDPQNAQLYDVLGQVYESLKDIDKAASYLEKAVELAPQNADYLTHLGRIYYNMGVEARGHADSVTDQKQYKVELEKAKDHFRKALPFFEKAYEMNPDNGSTVYALRSIYYSLDMDQFEKMDEIYMQKFSGESQE